MGDGSVQCVFRQLLALADWIGSEDAGVAFPAMCCDQQSRPERSFLRVASHMC